MTLCAVLSVHARGDISGEGYQQAFGGTCLAQLQPRTVVGSAVHAAVAPERLRAHASRCAVALPYLDRGWHRGRDGKVCHRHDDTLSRPLVVCALGGGDVSRPWDAMRKEVLGKGKAAGGPGRPFLCTRSTMWMLHVLRATCIIISILNSVAASGVWFLRGAGR